MKNTYHFIWIILLFGIATTSCASDKSSAALTVESFLQALTDKDEALMISYTCPEYELNAYLEFDSYALVKTSLENLSCEEIDEQNGITSVSCQGSIEASYGNEQRSFDLSERTYSVINANGAALVCGYTK